VAVARQVRQLRHLHEIVALDDVQLPEGGPVDGLVARQRRGVRAHGLRALVGLARLVEDEQLVAPGELLGRGDEARAVAQLLHVAHADLRGSVLRQVFEVLRKVHAGLVAGVDEVAEGHAQAPRNGIHRRAHVAALREQAHAARARLHGRGVEHRGEAGVRLAVQVGEAHGIGARDHHVRAGDEGFQLGLQRRALRARLGKARGIDDRGAHALGRAAPEHG